MSNLRFKEGMQPASREFDMRGVFIALDHKESQLDFLKKPSKVTGGHPQQKPHPVVGNLALFRFSSQRPDTCFFRSLHIELGE